MSPSLRAARRKTRIGLTSPGAFYAITMVFLGLVAAGLTIGWWMTHERKESLVLYSGQAGGTYQPLAREIASLLERENPGLHVEVQESEGSVANLRSVINSSDGRVLGILQNDVFLPDDLHDRGSSELRSLLPLHHGVLHFIVPENSSIRSIPDLRGKVIAVGSKNSGSPPIVEALLRHYEVPAELIESRQLSLQDAAQAFREKEVDAILMTMGLKSEEFERLVADVPLRFIGIGRSTAEGSEIEGFRLTYPFVQATMIPRFAYSAPTGERVGVPDEPVPAIAVRAVLIAHRDLPEVIANRIARTLVENKASLTRSHPSATQITEHFDPVQLQFPVHRGAHRYFHRDDPGFWQRNAEVLGFILSLLITAGGFFLSARKWIGQVRKNRIDAYYIELDQLIDPLHQSRLTLKELETLDHDLRSMQRKAIRQLAAEKLEANESFRIFQALLLEGREETRRQRRTREIQKIEEEGTANETG